MKISKIKQKKSFQTSNLIIITDRTLLSVLFLASVQLPKADATEAYAVGRLRTKVKELPKADATEAYAVGRLRTKVKELPKADATEAYAVEGLRMTCAITDF